MAAARKKIITAEDLYRFQLVSDVQISPDGEFIVYCLKGVNRKTEEKNSSIWLVPSRGGKPLRFTWSEKSDYMPRWSPDGKKIAFISNRHDEKQPQIYLIPFNGGEARKLTDLKGSISLLDWSPDGRKLLVTFTKKDEEELKREKNEHKRKLGIVSRRVTRIRFKLDGMGYRPVERIHIWTVDVRTEKAAQLTDGKQHAEYGPPSWSPDGKKIVFLSNISDDPDLDPAATDLFTMDSDGSNRKIIETPEGSKLMPVFSPDGQHIAYYGKKGKENSWRQMRLWVVPVDGIGKARNLTGKYDFNVSSWTLNDLPEGLHQSAPVWSPDGGSIFFQVAHHGNTLLKAISTAKDNKAKDVINEQGVVGTCSFNRSRTQVACIEGRMNNPGRIIIFNISEKRKKILVDHNRRLLSKIDPELVEELWIKGSDDNEIHGWILKPPGFDEKKSYPSILEIHGGPRTQYGNFFMHEFFFLAANGYVVHFCNPRGSQGYGEQHSRAITNAWGTVDYDDLMTWTDFIESKPYIDEARMGVTGGSYGGYMTNCIVGRTNRFKAAVTQRSVSNRISMYGSSDVNWIFQKELGDLPPWESFENYWNQSPMKNVGKVTTPTLVIHSENDLRCAIEQGEQFFVALKKQGVDTEMIRFPNESHGLSRGGRTDRRIDRLNHILRWFDKYLK